MNKYLRRVVIGQLAGGASSAVLVETLNNALLGMHLGTLVGIGYAVAFRPVPYAYVDNGMTAATLGVPLRTGVNVIALPLLSGEYP